MRRHRVGKTGEIYKKAPNRCAADRSGKRGKNAGPNRRERVRRRDEGGLQFAYHIHIRLPNATMQADNHISRGGKLTLFVSLLQTNFQPRRFTFASARICIYVYTIRSSIGITLPKIRSVVERVFRCVGVSQLFDRRALYTAYNLQRSRPRS